MPFRVLIVEDEVLIALDLADSVAELGGTVVGPAHTRAAGLGLAKTEVIDFALLDVNLREERSTDIARCLTQRGVPFVFLSGYSRADLPAEFDSCILLQKPCYPRDLKRAIRTAAGKAL